jgi:iron complex transport system substrate-binding protein
MLKQEKRRNGWKKGTLLLLTAVLAVSLAACGKSKENAGGASPSSSSSASPQVNAGGASTDPAKSAQTTYPLTLKDDTGTEITFDKAPERIVSISPSETEVLYAVGAGSKVVAVDNYSNYPDDAAKKPKVGDMNLNVEALLAQKADIVFANSSVNKKQVEQLRGLGVKVFGSDPKTVDEVIGRIELYGKIMNTADTAKKMADTMRAEKKQVVDAVKDAPKKRVYVEISPGYTVGSGVFIDELVTLGGGTNIMADQQRYPKVDPEAIVKANPEVILYSSPSVNPDELKKRPGWDTIDAVKNGRLYPIEDDLFSRVSPRLTQTLIKVGKAIQPDKVK